MQFQLPIQIPPFSPPITYEDKILLSGSCFTEHIGGYLAAHKFQTLLNPSGILFEPQKVCKSIIDYIENKIYVESDLIYDQELWHSWDHHSVFSNPSPERVLEGINQASTRAHQFLKQADWLILTFGSSFYYTYKPTGRIVANCHKFPGKDFEKKLGTIEETVTAIDTLLYRLRHFNPGIKIIFTISPVRHVRDGLIENNRSKARLIEAVHHVVEKFDRLYYFPSYELVIDVLRDHRFFDIDLVHPNYAATQFVLEKFCSHCLDKNTIKLLEEIREIVFAKNHKPFHPTSKKHQAFREKYYNLCSALQEKYPFLNFSDEIQFFQSLETSH